MVPGKEAEYNHIIEKLTQYAPVVVDHLDRDEPFQSYASSLYDFTSTQVHKERQAMFVPHIRGYIEKVFGVENIEFPDPLTINIVDHHAPITHPILIASNIASQAHVFLSGDRPAPAVVLSSAIVPPNNFLNKKGLHLHGKNVSLFSNKDIHTPAVRLDPQPFDIVARLKRIGSWNDFSDDEKQCIEGFDTVIGNTAVKECKTYVEQVSRVNNSIWKHLFANDVQSSVPELYHVPSEYIFCQAAADVFAEGSLLSRILFDRASRNRAIELFEGVTGCWSAAFKKGTHFFWDIRVEGKPRPLFLMDDVLVDEVGKVVLALDQASVIAALQRMEIIPGAFLRYAWEIFWLGIQPLTGYGSSAYLTRMKEQWLQFFDGEDDERARIELIDTKKLIAGEVVTYARGEDGDITEQYALDIVYRGGLSEEYIRQIRSMPFSSFVRPAILDIYKSYVPQSEQQKVMITQAELMGNNFDWII